MQDCDGVIADHIKSSQRKPSVMVTAEITSDRVTLDDKSKSKSWDVKFNENEVCFTCVSMDSML